MKSIVVIPARYESTRLPGKPLEMIGDKPMIQHVYERAIKSKFANNVIVATDDERILNAVKKFGGSVVMTSANHKSGTERIIEISNKYKADIYINVQGDEPFVKPEDIDKLIDAFKTNAAKNLATLCYPSSYLDALQVNKAKVIMNDNQNALYFSRAVIPYSTKPESIQYYIHIGMYGYRYVALQKLKNIENTSLETTEKLEQLKFLQAGFDIYVEITGKVGPSVDTSSCLDKARRYLKNGGEIYQQKNISSIKAIFMDVDGVLSPPALMFSKHGEEIKVFDVRDGMGIKNLLDYGIKLAVISGRGSEPLRYRLKKLGIDEYHFNTGDKGKKMRTLKKKFGLANESVLYIGDDLNDLPAFEEAEISCTVNDAPSEVKSRADIVLHSNGGSGAIRELSDLVIKVKG